MVTTQDEIERKHEGGRLTAETFAGLHGVAAVLGPDHHVLDASYYDTDDLRLCTAGITVRRRTGGTDEGWHAKLPVDAKHRREIHLPLTASADAVPGELTALLLAHSGGRDLLPCAHITTDRDRWQLVDRDGTVLAEVVHDAVRARTAEPRAGGLQVWHEIEVELAAGRPSLLDKMSRRLDKAGMPPSTRPSKLARTLDLPATRSPSSPGKKASATEVLSGYLRTQVEALRTADIALRLDEPDAVHDLRVAVRRMRSCLRVFRACFIRAEVRTVEADLKWLSDLLGSVRDTEVLDRAIATRLDDLPDDLILGPVSAELDRHLARPEATAMADLHAALIEDRYVSLVNALDNLLADPPFRTRANRRASTLLPNYVGRSYRAVCRAATKADAEPPGIAHAAALHAVRRKVKRLRYACEAVQPVLGTPAAKIRKRAKRIQRTLGDHHDNVVVASTLRDLGARAHLNGHNGFTFGLLLGQTRYDTEQQEDAFRSQWQRLAKPTAYRQILDHRA